MFSNIFKGNSEYYIEDAVKQNKINPRTFLIPSKEEIDNLEVENLVKLIFVMKRPQTNGCRAERMWVKIKFIDNDKFIGVLDNDPYYLKTIKSGDEITFQSNNIASIYSSESTLNEKMFAIITNKALEYRQINWAIRTDEKDSEEDSGWQLFYGGESADYLNDPNNAKIIFLENVLAFEPLLEKAFNSSGNNYKYSIDINDFEEIHE